MGTMDNPEPIKQEDQVGQDSHGDQNKVVVTRTKRRRVLDNLVQFSTIAWTLIANVSIGVFLGHFVDRALGTSPIFLILLSIIGVTSGLLFIANFTKFFKKN